MIRYQNNIGSFLSLSDQQQLLTKTITVIGAGGNGGYVLEFLSRLGFKKIIFFDGDSFEESNYNRQIYCNKKTIGKNKAFCAAQYIKNINPEVEIEYYPYMFSKNDILKILQSDIIIDCADGLKNEDLQAILNVGIPYAFQGNIEQGIIVSIFTNKKFFQSFINEVIQEGKIFTPEISQPAYLCSLAASIVCNEVIKFLLHRSCAIGYFLIYDIVNNQIKKDYI